MSNFSYDAPETPAPAPAPRSFEFDRIDRPDGVDGHRWQVFVDGEWQGGVCASGCAKETAEEHVV